MRKDKERTGTTSKQPGWKQRWILHSPTPKELTYGWGECDVQCYLYPSCYSDRHHKLKLPLPQHHRITTTHSYGRGKQPINHRGRLQHRMKNPPQYKTPMVQRSIEEYTQRTPPVRGASDERRGKEGKRKAATRNPQRKESSSSSNSMKNSIFKFLHALPRAVIEKHCIITPTHNHNPNIRSSTGIG